MSPLTLIVVSVCVASAATLFFSTCSFSIKLFSRVKIAEAFANRGKDFLKEKFFQNREKIFTACSFFKIICNLLIAVLLFAGFMKTSKSPMEFNTYIVIFIIALAIFFTFTLALPLTLAKYAGEKILSSTFGLLLFFAALAWPALCFFRFYDLIVKRLAGVGEATPQEKQEEKEEEFLHGLEQRKIEGVVDEEEQEMIENVLEFTDTAVDEILTPRTDLVAIDVNTDLPEIINIISKAGFTRFPVYEDNFDNIIGLLYAKDLLTEIGQNPAEFKLKQKLRKAYFVPETKPLRSLLHEFQNQKLHIAVVLDEYGGTAGIVTLEDIIEELVGEITDEYEETPAQQIKVIDENIIEVDARTYIDEINDQFKMDLPEEEDYDTIGGFVFSYLGYIPKPQEKFLYQNLTFTISSAEARKIKRIKITRLPEDHNVE